MAVPSLWQSVVLLVSIADVRVVAEAVGRLSQDAAIILGSNKLINLRGNTASPAVVILDYGRDVEGIPTFEVIAASGDTSRFEITYSETMAVLNGSYMSDGPLPMAAAMDSYRINQYNINNTSTVTNRLIQGGFRYQKLNLSTDGELTLQNVGVKPTTSATPLAQLPGSFDCSDEDLTRIWATGARTILLNEIPANSVPDFWKVTQEGALVESQVPQVLSGLTASELTTYNLDFQVKPVIGGFGFSVLADTLNSGIYILCNVSGRTIEAYDGQTERGSTLLASAALPANVTLGQWHSISATIEMTNIGISIDGVSVLQFTQTASFYGSFGLGSSLGHSALFRNLTAVQSTGESVFSSTLTDDSFLSDFLMGTNPLDTLVDGSKRDRIAYSGDLDVAVGALFASTNSSSFARGTIDLLSSYQLPPGFFVPDAKIQQAPLTSTIDADITGLIGYSFEMLSAAAQFYMMTGDASFAQSWAPKAVAMLDWANSQVLSNGLFNVSESSFGGDWNYYDPDQSGVVAKFNTIYAYSLQQTIPLLKDAGVNTTEYQARLSALRTAIDTQLFSDDLGAYFLSEAVTYGFGQDSNAIAILANIPSGNHTATGILSTLSKLFTTAGPLSFSDSVIDAGWSQIISPFASAFHLRAAFLANDTTTALSLLKTLWAPMANPHHTNYTGCFWEALDSTGAPGLGKDTSLCHAWAAGPTAELSSNVLGIKPVKPGFTEWKVAPQPIGLKWAKGKVPVPSGYIGVDWRFTNGLLTMRVESPVGTTGTVFLPSTMETTPSRSTLRLNGKVVKEHTFKVNGGDSFLLVQSRE